MKTVSLVSRAVYFLLTGVSYAGLIAFDGFEDYEVGSLNGMHGGIGFPAAYSAQPGVTLVEKTMAYTNGAVEVVGGDLCMKVTTNGDPIFARAIPAQTGTYYLSFLYETPTGGGESAEEDLFMLGCRNGTGRPLGGVIHRNKTGSLRKLGLRAGGNDQYSELVGENNTTYFLVVKFSKSGTGQYDQLSLYVNPSTLEEPASPCYSLSANTGFTEANFLSSWTLFLESSDIYYLDNLLLASDWATAVSPPATPPSPRLDPPQFSPGGGIYTNDVTVVLSTTLPDTMIRYTLDGTVPSETEGVIYSDPFVVRSSVVVTARAFKDGHVASEPVSVAFDIALDGALVAVEDFEQCALGPLGGARSGKGFFGAWNAPSEQLSVVEKALSYSAGQIEIPAGKKALRVGASGSGIGNVAGRGFAPLDADSVYLSCLVAIDFPLPPSARSVVGLGTSAVERPTTAFMVKPGISTFDLQDDYALGTLFLAANQLPAERNVDYAFENGTTYFVVMRFYKHGATNQYNSYQIFVNPETLTEPETATYSHTLAGDQGAEYSHVSLNAVNMASPYTYYIDQIMVGKTYASVVRSPGPPSTVIMLR